LDLSGLADKDAAAQSKRNDIKEIRNYKQLEKVDLDFDSPRLKKALHNLGVSKEECMKK
jgi:16S rRNA U1498 N3-methylase RsmE